LARDPISRELWYIVSDEQTSLQTFREYGERFCIEEEFLDEKSNGVSSSNNRWFAHPLLYLVCVWFWQSPHYF
jgi:hypothetical protein